MTGEPVRVVEVVGATGGAVGERGPGGRARCAATIPTTVHSGVPPSAPNDGAHGRRAAGLGGAGQHHAQRVDAARRTGAIAASGQSASAVLTTNSARRAVTLMAAR